MKNEKLVEMLRNPQLRNNIEFVHPSGESEVNFIFDEVDIDAETYTPTTITYSSVPCSEIAATIILT